MKTSTIAIIAVIAVVLVGGLAYWHSTQNQPYTAPAAYEPSQPATTPTPSPSGQTSPPAASATATITYTDAGFSPSTITVAKGTTVTFKNMASDAFWPASNVHPVHSAYDGTTLQEHCANPTSSTFDACGGIQPGDSWSFTFNKVGTWQYHNHLDPSEGGTVVVQ